MVLVETEQNPLPEWDVMAMKIGSVIENVSNGSDIPGIADGRDDSCSWNALLELYVKLDVDALIHDDSSSCKQFSCGFWDCA
ncbi:hypothetical protein M5689_005719 [Euphorbia peplus]|nr:hypothetical protein M5689_005719 [Euphorbia peplus]